MTSVRDVPAAGRRLAHLPPLARIERRDDEAVVAGVCSGLAHALGVDVSAVRLVFAILTFAGGSGIVLYLGAWLLLAPPGAPTRIREGGARIAGIALIGGAALLATR